MIHARLLLASLPLLSGGCAQSYAEGVAVICEAPAHCTGCDSPDEAVRQTKLAEYIEARLDNRDAKELFQALAAADPETKRHILLEESRARGLASCPFAE